MNLHKATMDDAEFLFRLANDPDTLRFSRSQQTFIPWEKHLLWMEQSLAQREVWLVGVAGTVSINRGEIAVTVAPEYRGLGLATPLILAGVQACHSRPLLAVVHVDNGRSSKAFRRAGFTRVDWEGHWYSMWRDR
jgi:RimJ/RimL family protein N-acetyltransferase